MMYQMTFAIITVALVAGAVADRMRFSAFLLFAVIWFFVVYVPLAHWVWGGGFLQAMGLLDFAGGRWCISMPGSPDWSPLSCSASGAAATGKSRAL